MNELELGLSALTGPELVGPNSIAAPTSQQLEAELKFCSCVGPNGISIPREQCINPGGPGVAPGRCRPSLARNNPNYRRISVESGSNTVSTFSREYREGSRRYVGEVTWRWFEAVQSSSDWNFRQTPSGDVEVDGVIAGVVEQSTPFSPRDQLGDSRMTHNYIELPHFVISSGPLVTVEDRDMRNNLSWLRLMNLPIDGPFGPIPFEPGFGVVQIRSGVPWLVNPASELDLTQTLPSEAIDLASNPTMTWRAPVEAGFSSLPGNAWSRVAVILPLREDVEEGESLRSLRWSSEDGRFETDSHPAFPSWSLFDLSVSDGEYAVYSALFDAVFFAGDPAMPKAILRYSLQTGRIDAVPLADLGGDERVIGFTMDPLQRLGFVLAQGPTNARLLQVDLESTESVSLLELPVDRPAERPNCVIHTTASGDLVLGSSRDGMIHAWRIEVESGEANVAAYESLNGTLVGAGIVEGETWHLTTQLPDDESALMKMELSQGPFTQLPGL